MNAVARQVRLAGLAALVAIGASGCGGPSGADAEPMSSPRPGASAASAETGRDAEFVEATAAEHAEDMPEPSPLAAEPADVALLEQAVAYGETDGANLTGYLAMPRDAIEPLPGVIVIHEWWGLNDNVKAMTRRLAAEGYIALAVDLYGGAVADTPSAAEELMRGVTSSPEAVELNLLMAYEYLAEHALSPRIGVIGWCLGGGWALETALLLPGELDAAVMYYGRLVTDEQRLARLTTPLLGSFGELDESIPASDVLEFRSRLGDMGKNVDIQIYPEARHAFANPSGGNYEPEAAAHAWERTLEFLDRYLR